MHVADGGTIEFAYGRDWQVTTGALTGGTSAPGNAPGHFLVKTGQPFYFTGDTSLYAGKTTIEGGSRFYLPAVQVYGAANDASGNGGARAFFVSNGSLHGGGGAVLNASTFDMTLAPERSRCWRPRPADFSSTSRRR